MSGVIHGAREFLIGGYLLTWIVLSSYAFSLLFRSRRLKKELKDV